MQVVQVKASQSTVKMGIDYDNQYQVDIPLTVRCFAHTAVSMRVQCRSPLLQCTHVANSPILMLHVACCIRGTVTWGHARLLCSSALYVSVI